MLVAVWATPIALAGMAFQGARNEEKRSVTGAAAAVVTVGSRQESVAKPVTIRIHTEAPPEVSTQLSGTVTAMHIGQGEPVITGTRLFALDGHIIYALAEEVPIYRELTFGDSGADVLSLARLLVENGLLDPAAADSRFGPRLRAAVSEFQSLNGYDKDGVFRPAYVVYVAPGFGAVDTVSVKVGDVPSGTWKVMTGVVSATGAEIRSGDGADRLARISEDPIDIVIGTERIGLGSFDPDPAEATLLFSALTTGEAVGNVKATASEDDPRAIDFVGALAQERTAGRVGTVPATAIYVGIRGSSCLFESGSPDAWSTSGMRVRVLPDPQVNAGELGQALVDAELVGAVVARDPLLLEPEARARCK